MNIRTRLLLLVLSILIPAFIASTFAIWYVYKEEKDAEYKSLGGTSRALAALIDKELQTTEAVLHTLAQSPALDQGDLKTFYAHAKKIAPPPESTIVLSDLEGYRLFNTRIPFGDELPKGKVAVADLRKQIGPTKTLISNVFFAPVGKSYDFSIQIPVMQGDDVRYYLTMGMGAERLQPLLANQRFPSGWIISVLDRNGVVVTRSQDPAKFVGKLSNPGIRQKVLAGERHGVHYGTTLDGVDTVAFFARAPLSEWTVLVNVPLAEMRKPAIRAAVLAGGMILLLLFIGFFLARWHARKTALPIERLGLAAERLGRGERVTTSPTGLTETDSVSMAIERASWEIAQSKTHLELRIAEAVAAAERAQRALLQSQKLEALGRLTGGIAHDFNNILQTLATSQQLMRVTSDPGKINELIEIGEKAVARATSLISQLRSFGRVQDASLETVHLNTTINGAMPLLKSALTSNMELHLKLADDTWPVTLDILQFELALLNIVINARDAMPNGGVVVLEVQNENLAENERGLSPGNYVRITVVDNGVGMSPDVLAKALDPFYTTKSVDKGTGLGLPQAYGFTTQANGTLVLTSIEGQGTTVTMYLPRSADNIKMKRDDSIPLKAVGNDDGTLLFVEDDPLVRATVAPALENAGFKVVVAHNGDEALALLESDLSISLVFSDVVMPGKIDGVGLAKIVQRRFPNVRIVLATGYADKRIDLSGVHLLAKPYDIAEAIRTLDMVT